MIFLCFLFSLQILWPLPCCSGGIYSAKGFHDIPFFCFLAESSHASIISPRTATILRSSDLVWKLSVSHYKTQLLKLDIRDIRVVF